MTNNVYKQIDGLDKYEISKNGVIRNIKTSKIISTYSSKGYKMATLYKTINKKTKKNNYSIHRLLAISFIDNPNNYPYVNHIDGNSSNYNINNLEWCTQKYNIYHSRNISKNGSVISRQKIIYLFDNNKDLNKDEFLLLLLDNCK
jgi:hypothetical protein